MLEPAAVSFCRLLKTLLGFVNLRFLLKFYAGGDGFVALRAGTVKVLFELLPGFSRLRTVWLKTGATGNVMACRVK